MLPTISNKFTLQALHPLDQRFLEVRGTFYLHIFYSRFLLYHRFSCLDFIFIFTKQILYHFYFVSHSTTASSTVILKRKYPLQTTKSQNYSENYLYHLSSHFHFPIYTQTTISKNIHAFTVSTIFPRIYWEWSDLLGMIPQKPRMMTMCITFWRPCI